ncbi:MAG: hypothetical protein R3F08_07555 [Dokdonella sp.]
MLFCKVAKSIARERAPTKATNAQRGLRWLSTRCGVVVGAALAAMLLCKVAKSIARERAPAKATNAQRGLRWLSTRCGVVVGAALAATLLCKVAKSIARERAPTMGMRCVARASMAFDALPLRCCFSRDAFRNMMKGIEPEGFLQGASVGHRRY